MTQLAVGHHNRRLPAAEMLLHQTATSDRQEVVGVTATTIMTHAVS